MTDSTQYGTLPQGTAYYTNYTCQEGLNNNCRVVHAADPQWSSGGGMDYVLQCTRPYSKWIFSLSYLLFDLSLFLFLPLFFHLFLSVSLYFCLSLSLLFSPSLSPSRLVMKMMLGSHEVYLQLMLLLVYILIHCLVILRYVSVDSIDMCVV